MTDKKPVIITIIGIVVSAVVSITLMVLSFMGVELGKKADKDVMDREFGHVEQRINAEEKNRIHNDNLLSDRVQRIENNDDVENVK